MAGDQHLDPATEDAERLVLAHDLEAAVAGGRVDDVLGLERRLADRALGRGRLGRVSPRTARASAPSSPAPVGAETASTPATRSPSRSRQAATSRSTTSSGTRSRFESTTSSGSPLEAGAVRGELGAHGLVRGHRVDLSRPDLAAEGDEVNEQPAALDVGEELVTEPDPLGGALDQAGDVGEHELALAVVDRPQDRLEGRERVVGDLRRRAGEAREQRRLAGVRQPDQAGVGEQLQPQLDPARLALQPALGEARRLTGRAGEALVAVPAGAARRRRPPAGPARPGRSGGPRGPRPGCRAEPGSPRPRHGRRGAARPRRGRRARRAGAARTAARRGRGARDRRPAPRRRRARRRRRRARRGGRAPRA